MKRKLNIDMKVRWNSTFKMIDKALFYKDVLIHLGLKYASIKINVPLDSKWEKLVAIHKFLKIFYDVTCMFSAVKTPTSNLYFKGAWLIYCHLLRTKSGSHAFLSSIVDPMLKKFDKYWKEYNLQLSCAAILDPRFKLKFVEFCLVKVFGEEEGMV